MTQVAVLRPFNELELPDEHGPEPPAAGRRAFGIARNRLFSHRGLFHPPFFLILFSATLAGIVARGHSRKTFAWLWLLFPWRPLYTPPGGIEVPDFH
jgi:hypothetical protein